MTLVERIDIRYPLGRGLAKRMPNPKLDKDH